MPTLPEIEQLVKEDWPSEPVALDLLHAIVALEVDFTDYITIPAMVQLLDAEHGVELSVHAGDVERIRLVYRWSEYLATERIGLLDPHFELIRDDDDDSVVLDTHAVFLALQTGRLNDPDTGAPIPDWREHVVPYYSATKRLKELLGERR